jgi:hypothetical protein
MITHLTSELNRINQEMEELNKFLLPNIEKSNTPEFTNNLNRWSDLNTEKETLKKVSLMWANEVLDKMRMWVGGFKDEVQEIKSLIENQKDFQKLGSHEPSQMEKA